MQAKLTKRAVDAATATERDLWLWDSELKGFGLRVRPSGRKTYVVEYRPGEGGRKAPKRRYVIGAHGSPWTPDTARAEALKVLGAARAGKDPAADRSAARKREGDTVAEIAAVFIAKYAKPRTRTWKETERVLNRDVLPVLGRKAIADVTRQDVLRLIDSRAESAPIMANRLLAYLRKLFNWCVERGYLAVSPIAGMKPPAESKSRDRVLDDGELVEVWRAAEAVGGYWAPMVKLLILTGQRRSEVVGMRWSEIDLDAAEWRIAADRAKNKQAHTVPLVGAALDVLKSIPRISYRDDSGRVVESDLVFTTTGRTPVSGLSKFKTALDRTILRARREAAGADAEGAKAIPAWVFHDLRRSLATGLQRLGVRLEVTEAVLNHIAGSRAGIVGVYQRHNWAVEKRAALEGWERHVLASLHSCGSKADVIAFPNARGAA